LVKRILLTLLQFFAFCALLMIGGYWDVIRLILELRAPSFNVIPLWKFNVSAGHDLIANGLVYALVLLLLLLGLEAWRKALRPWAALTILAFVAATALCFAAKVGLPPSS
jgi:hypothetical protein